MTLSTCSNALMSLCPLQNMEGRHGQWTLSQTFAVMHSSPVWVKARFCLFTGSFLLPPRGFVSFFFWSSAGDLTIRYVFFRGGTTGVLNQTENSPFFGVTMVVFLSWHLGFPSIIVLSGFNREPQWSNQCWSSRMLAKANKSHPSLASDFSIRISSLFRNLMEGAYCPVQVEQKR